MDKYRRVCRLAASAPTDGISTGAGSRRALAALALPESGQKEPGSCLQAVPVLWSRTAGSRALLIQQEGTREMAELQQITLFKTESPKYIRIDIIKQGSVDRKVQCHPHQDPWWREVCFTEGFYEVNYINYQHLKTSNI